MATAAAKPIEPPSGPPPAERRALGRALRKEAPRSSHAVVELPGGRDPLAILEAQSRTRLPGLVPLRWTRMAASPFAFFRGAAAVMAADLAGSARTGIDVQACGDAHLLNFGLYASPERTLMFDLKVWRWPGEGSDLLEGRVPLKRRVALERRFPLEPSPICPGAARNHGRHGREDGESSRSLMHGLQG
jgi:hypothetical protein